MIRSGAPLPSLLRRKFQHSNNFDWTDVTLDVIDNLGASSGLFCGALEFRSTRERQPVKVCPWRSSVDAPALTSLISSPTCRFAADAAALAPVGVAGGDDARGDQHRFVGAAVERAGPPTTPSRRRLAVAGQLAAASGDADRSVKKSEINRSALNPDNQYCRSRFRHRPAAADQPLDCSASMRARTRSAAAAHSRRASGSRSGSSSARSRCRSAHSRSASVSTKLTCGSLRSMVIEW